LDSGSFAWHTCTSQIVGMDQQPFGRDADLFYFVLVGDILVVAQSLPPELPDALTVMLHLLVERRCVGGCRRQGPLADQQFRPGTHVVTGPGVRPGYVERRGTSRVDGRLD